MEKGAGEIILLVEDNTMVRKTIRAMLDHLGYKVIEAVDGNHALEKFRESRNEICLVLLDVVMPGKNGREVYEEVKRLCPDIQVIFMSGYTAGHLNPEEMDKELRFIHKPFTLSRLSEELDRALYPES